MRRFAPDQVSAIVRFVSRDWASNADPAGGAALLTRFGVARAAAPAEYEMVRAAYQSGFVSTAPDAALTDRAPPPDPTLAAVWQAGRTAGTQYRQRRRSRVQAVWLGTGLVVAATVVLALLSLR